MSNTVVLSNVFPDNNKGGAAITSATIRAVQRALPGCEVVLVATQVDGAELSDTHRFTVARHPDVRVEMPIVRASRGWLAGLRTVMRSIPHVLRDPRKSDHPLVREIASARMVVSKGGYVFVERHSLRRLLRVWLTAFPLIVASRAGVRTVATGATIGPFSTWYSRALNRWILRRVDFIFPRDEYSYQEALKLGVPPERLMMLPDIVFSHPAPSAGARAETLSRLGLEGMRFAAVTVIRGSGDRQFLPAVREALLQLLNDGTIDRAAVVVQSLEDLEVSREFHASFDDSRVLLLDQDLSPDELMGVYGGARFVVARRMHSAIFSLIAGTPTFAVVFLGRKVQGVMRSLGLEKYLVGCPDVSSSELVERVREALVHEAEVRETIRTAVERAGKELDELPRALRRVMESGGGPDRVPAAGLSPAATLVGERESA